MGVLKIVVFPKMLWIDFESVELESRYECESIFLHTPKIYMSFLKYRIELIDWIYCMHVCVEADLVDYDEELDCHHLEMKQYVPNQEYLDHKIMKLHKTHRYNVLTGADVLIFTPKPPKGRKRISKPAKL